MVCAQDSDGLITPSTIKKLVSFFSQTLAKTVVYWCTSSGDHARQDSMEPWEDYGEKKPTVLER